jgi:hypothetical protein
MLVTTLLAQSVQCLVQLIQIVDVLATWTSTLHDMLGKSLWVLWSKKLRIVWQADVYQAPNLLRNSGVTIRCVNSVVCCRHVLIEGCILDAVAIDLSNIEILLHRRYMLRWNAVSCTPDSWWCGGMLS